MDTVIMIDGEQVTETLQDLSIQDQSKAKAVAVAVVEGCAGADGGQPVVEVGEDQHHYHHHGVCAICLNKIVLQETALVKGCEHAYCVICILRWATYKKEPSCPQCKHPFEFLHLHRSLDGSIHDYMFEESVCLLLRASWFNPLIVENHEELEDEIEDFYLYGDEEEDLDDVYLGSSSNLRIGNRRWGDNGYVRGGRQEARPVNHHRPNPEDDSSGAGPSRSRVPKKKEASPNTKDTAAAVGRRAKRTLKREAADKAAAAKHQQHLVRLGRT